MTKIAILIGDVDGFFERAKGAAQRADRGEAFEGKVTLSFEDRALASREEAKLSGEYYSSEEVHDELGRMLNEAEAKHG